MEWEHEKSGPTIFLDVVRNLLILAATGYAGFLIWEWNWIVALIVAIPVYVIMLNVIGLLMVPLYLLTPETRLRTKVFKAMKNGDLEQSDALTNEFIEKFNVNVPESAIAEK